ncbi:hypothetical protein EJ110_NYTH14362 [Nymphaea thermarum]|nr:hypothetical protein EJ110_NYTH14362 [Nymphaea thermarum]
MNNVSFFNPSIDVLDAYYRTMKNVYTTDFPSFPTYLFNFTAESLSDDLSYTSIGTRVKVLEYNQTVEVVYQGTSNFDPEKDPLNYNLVDPPRENTVTVPYGGWAAMRFREDNPGVWLLHCHFDSHFIWGMSTVFIIKDGPTNETSMLPPPKYMPKCDDSMAIDNTGAYHPSDH